MSAFVVGGLITADSRRDELKESGALHALFDEAVALDEMNAKLLGLRFFIAFRPLN
jgi:hypothetical protein